MYLIKIILIGLLKKVFLANKFIQGLHLFISLSAQHKVMDSLCLDFGKHSEQDLKNECGRKESMSAWWGSRDPQQEIAERSRDWELVGQQLRGKGTVRG